MLGALRSKKVLAGTAGVSLPGVMAAVLGSIILSGCVFAKRDSIVVGSVPDDYRTTHPIVVSETDIRLDMPVGDTATGLGKEEGGTLAGFLERYDTRSGALVTLQVPSGARNELAASYVASDMTDVMVAYGVPPQNIVILSYQAPFADYAAPIRVSYPTMTASTGQCGRWPDDLLDTTDNKHYADFGCSYQKNLAAQIANPADFLGPRKQTEIDAENRAAVIKRYRGKKGDDAEPGRVSAEFNQRSEVDYD